LLSISQIRNQKSTINNHKSLMLIQNSRGNYRFLKGIGAYSSGVIADPGYEIVHVTFAMPVPVRAGFERIVRHMLDASRPVHALCAIELRSPRPFPFDGFSAFNATYAATLADLDLLTEGLNPIARTNVAPEVDPPSEPVLSSFSYSVPARDGGISPTFVVAGAGELIEDQYDMQHIVRPGETSDEAMREKAQCVLEHLQRRLAGLGANWAQVNVVNIYTVRNIHSFLRDDILARISAAALTGIRWHYARPPIEGLEFEMDVRAVGIDFQAHATKG
jgi:hypothetical protein